MKKQDLINNYQHLFWYVKKSELRNISDNVLVEFILNYGSMQAVKDLLETLGKEQVAKEFSKAIKEKRINYFPQVKHFFNLYFQKNVPQYPF